MRHLAASEQHGSQRRVAECEPDSGLRDTEQIPVHEEGGTEGCLRCQALSRAEDARHVPNSMKIGYETSCSRCCRKPDPMRAPDIEPGGFSGCGEGDGGAA